MRQIPSLPRKSMSGLVMFRPENMKRLSLSLSLRPNRQEFVGESGREKAPGARFAEDIPQVKGIMI